MLEVMVLSLGRPMDFLQDAELVSGRARVTETGGVLPAGALREVPSVSFRDLEPWSFCSRQNAWAPLSCLESRRS